MIRSCETNLKVIESWGEGYWLSAECGLQGRSGPVVSGQHSQGQQADAKSGHPEGGPVSCVFGATSGFVCQRDHDGSPLH